MAANSHEDRTHWVSAIQDSIQVDPVYDIVRQKKAALQRKSIRFVNIFDLTSFFTNILTLTNFVKNISIIFADHLIMIFQLIHFPKTGI